MVEEWQDKKKKQWAASASSTTRAQNLHTTRAGGGSSSTDEEMGRSRGSVVLGLNLPKDNDEDINSLNALYESQMDSFEKRGNTLYSGTAASAATGSQS